MALSPFKIKPKHHSDLVKLILYANNLYRRKLRKVDNTENIPLTNFYRAMPSSHRSLVKIAFNIFFDQKLRGCSRARKTSLWLRRDKPRLNAQLNRMLFELKESNVHVIKEMFIIATSKTENIVTLTTTTVIEFEDPKKRDEFAALLSALADGQQVE